MSTGAPSYTVHCQEEPGESNRYITFTEFRPDKLIKNYQNYYNWGKGRKINNNFPKSLDFHP